MSKKRKYQVGGKPATPEDQAAFDWMKSYLASSKYKERLGNFWQNPEYIQQQRLKNLEGTTFSNTPTGYSSSYGHGDMSMAAQEFTPSTLAALRSQYNNPHLTLNRGATVAHELGHASNSINPRVPLRLNPLEQSYIFNRNKGVSPAYRQDIYQRITEGNQPGAYYDASNPNNDIVGAQRAADRHDEDPSENLSDVQAVRYLANKYKIYDARTQNLTPDILKKIKSDPRIANELHGNRLFKDFDDPALLDIFNKVAYNNTQNTPGQYTAQVGGDLKYAPAGPDLPTMQNPADIAQPLQYVPITPRQRPQFQLQQPPKWKSVAKGVGQGLTDLLYGADFAANAVDNAKEKRHFNDQYLNALRSRSYYNANEKGTNNIPIISKNGGEMNVFSYPYKKGKFYNVGGPVQYAYIPNASRQPYRTGGENAEFEILTDPTPYPNWVRPNGENRIKWKEGGTINYNRASTIGSFFPPQYFMDGGPVDFDASVGLDAIFMDGGPVDYNSSTGLDAIYQTGGKLTAAKAKQMLKDGTAQGHPLTPAQKRYFGFIAGGGKPKAQHGGIPWPDHVYFPEAQRGGRVDNAWISEGTGLDGIFMDGGPVDFNQATGLDAIFCLGGPTDYDASVGLDGIFERGGYINPGHVGSDPAIDAYYQSIGLDGIYKKGGIHINPANKGKFTAKAKTKFKHMFGGYSSNQNFTPPAFTPIIDAHKTGGYSVGDMVDLTPDQIEHLQNQGYDFRLVNNSYSIR